MMRSDRQTWRMKELLSDASARAIRYLDALPNRAVAPTPEAIAALQAFDEPMPEASSDPAATLSLLDEVGSPATIASRVSSFWRRAVINSSTVGAFG